MGSQRLFSGPSEESLPPSASGGRGGLAWRWPLLTQRVLSRFSPAGQAKPRAPAASLLWGLQGPGDWNSHPPPQRVLAWVPELLYNRLWRS